MRRCRLAQRGFRLSVRMDKAWQVDLHRTAMAWLAVDRHMSAGLFDEAVYHRQSQSGSLTQRLRGEEWLEYLAHHLWRHAGAGISDGEHYILTRCHLGMCRGVSRIKTRIRSLDSQLATTRHRIT